MADCTFYAEIQNILTFRPTFSASDIFVSCPLKSCTVSCCPCSAEVLYGILLSLFRWSPVRYLIVLAPLKSCTVSCCPCSAKVLYGILLSLFRWSSVRYLVVLVPLKSCTVSYCPCSAEILYNILFPSSKLPTFLSIHFTLCCRYRPAYC
jgi:hypothetical protein